MDATRTTAAGALLAAATARLAGAGIGPARHEALLLLAAASGHPRSRLLLDRHLALGPDVAGRFADLVERRRRRVPLQHLLGHWTFLDFELRVDSRALVPRFETEELAAWAIGAARERGVRRAVDVGTGSGCLALALARAGVRVVAVDTSAAALSLARENVVRLGMTGRVALVRGTLASALAPRSVGMIVANLPYVAPGELGRLEPEVRDHEPREALVAGRGGRALIESLIDEAPRVLGEGGELLIECDPRQVAPLRERLAGGSWHDVTVRRDLSGRPRMIRARRGERTAPDGTTG